MKERSRLTHFSFQALFLDINIFTLSGVPTLNLIDPIKSPNHKSCQPIAHKEKKILPSLPFPRRRKDGARGARMEVT